MNKIDKFWLVKIGPSWQGPLWMFVAENYETAKDFVFEIMERSAYADWSIDEDDDSLSVYSENLKIWIEIEQAEYLSKSSINILLNSVANIFAFKTLDNEEKHNNA